MACGLGPDVQYQRKLFLVDNIPQEKTSKFFDELGINQNFFKARCIKYYNGQVRYFHFIFSVIQF